MKILLAAVLIAVVCSTACAEPETTEADVVILGGSPSGLAAAVQAARLGASVIVVEPSGHIGGLMSGGLTRTDFGDRNSTGGIPVEVFRRIAVHYDSEKKPWPQQPMKVFFEPHVAEKVLWGMVNETGRVKVIVSGQLVDVELKGNTLTGMTIRLVSSDKMQRIRGKVFIDATYEGDLAARAGAPFKVGREARSEFNEPHGLEVADKLLQAYCFRLCVTDDPDNRVPIDKPTGYVPEEFELLSDYVRTKKIKRFAPDCLFAREMVNRKADGNAQWRCWVSTDWAGFHTDYPEGSYSRREEIYEEYKRRTLGWFYFLQHDPSVPELLRKDALRWGLAKDEFADTDHLPFMLYVREARRIMGEYVFSELDATRNTTKSDSIGCGGYHIDSHHVTDYNRNNLHLEIPVGNLRVAAVKGYQIPYRILVPQKVEGLLVSLCVSSTHLGYCSLRMEPEYMKMGQAAGAAAYLASRNGVAPRNVDVQQLQDTLRKAGAILEK
ncbi:MAG: FAD-dependent oxidoreductase [Fuerstiella sp.]|nr:FAD-dependent oxidoreductase [Fuerstiella sp.]MCP4859131.1 FAD-dependent oxidoreductase [Fuerstiella sp.]